MICDYIDGKFRKDTPEEYVRQTIEKRLVNEHKYRREQIKIEFGLKLGSRRPRADVVIFPNDNPDFKQEHVGLIIECKNEKVEPRNRKGRCRSTQILYECLSKLRVGYVDKWQIQRSIEKG